MKYGDLRFSQYTRVLHNRGETVVGNIANDGRWIKLQAESFDTLYDKFSNEPEKEIEVVFLDTVRALTDIKALKPVDFDEMSVKIKEVTLELTTQCNMHCRHCSYSFGSTSEYVEMDPDMIYGITRWCAEEGVKRITLTGGEIFCRKDIYDIISNIRRLFEGRIDIITNGTIIKKTGIDQLIQAVDQINISLDGYDEASVQEIRGAEVFGKIMVLIHDLKQKGYNNIWISSIDTNNPDKNQKFEALAAQLGVKSIIRQLNLKGRARENFTYKDMDYYQDETGSAKAATMKCVCNSTYHTVFVSARGLIQPCAALREDQHKIGQVVYDGGRFDIHVNLSDNEPVVEKILPCRECNVRYFCTSTCASQNNQIYLTEEILKIRCDKQKRVLMKTVWGT